jgi:hypothetical protein
MPTGLKLTGISLAVLGSMARHAHRHSARWLAAPRASAPIRLVRFTRAAPFPRSPLARSTPSGPVRAFPTGPVQYPSGPIRGYATEPVRVN